MGKQPDRLLKAILIWTAFVGVFFWLPTVRGLIDGPSYEWGLGVIGGNGLGGDYWVVALIAAFTATTLYLGWRGGRGPFAALLLLWHVPFGVLGLAGVLFYRDAIPPLRGDTLDFEMPLAWAALIPTVFAALAIWWVVRHIRGGWAVDRQPPAWTMANRVIGLIAVALVPLQIWMLRPGEPHDATDQIGVMLTMLQWVLLNLAAVPWRSRAVGQRGGVRPGSAAQV